MIILLFITSTLGSHIYPVFLMQTTKFQFQLEYDSGSLTVDINSEMSYLNKKGDTIRCNSAPFGEQIKCWDCSPDCMMDGANLMQSEIRLIDVFNNEESEPIIYLGTNEQEKLGLGLQRGSKFAQNPFVSNMFHICFGFTRGFISSEYKNPNQVQLMYKANESNYQVDLKMIKINEEMKMDTSFKVTYVDSVESFILLPQDQFIQIQEYLKHFGVEKQGDFLIVKDKSKELPTIELIFEQNQKIRLEKDAYSYVSIDGNRIVSFYKSTINRIKLGIPFFTQQLITIDQNNQKLLISKYDCQDHFKQTKQDDIYLKHIIIPLFLVCLILYCILKQRKKSEVKKRQLEQQELVKLKEEEEQI